MYAERVFYIIKRFKRGKRRGGVRAYSHCQRVENNILFLYSVFRGGAKNFFGNLYASPGCGRNTVFVKRERNNKSAVFLYKRKNRLHAFALAVYGINHGFPVVAP